MATLSSEALIFVNADLPHLRRPDDILDAMHRRVAVTAGLRMLASWRVPFKPENVAQNRLGLNWFAHPSMPQQFFTEFLPLVYSKGPSFLSLTAWQNRGAFTVSEAMRAFKPTREDRWIIDLEISYGMRDGLYVPAGRWIMVYWSSQVLKLARETRATLSFAAIHAAARLEEIVRHRFPEKRPPQLTTREVVVLRGYSLGQSSEEIAADLGLKESTVRTFLRRAQRKLKAKTPTHAVAEAMRGLLLR
jgi:DNA-binding CsgD family transcriptional regulator